MTHGSTPRPRATNYLPLKDALRVVEHWFVACPGCGARYLTTWKQHVPEFCSKCKGSMPELIAACRRTRIGEEPDYLDSGIPLKVYPIVGAAERYRARRQRRVREMAETIAHAREMEEADQSDE